MNCPKCGSRMEVTHTYRVERGSTQRLQCENKKCGTIATAVRLLVAINPRYGDGAAAIRRVLDERYPVTRT